MAYPYCVVMMANGCLYEFNADTHFEAEYIFEQAQAGAYVPASDIDALNIVVDCPVHGWSPTWNGLCDACTDEPFMDIHNHA